MRYIASPFCAFACSRRAGEPSPSTVPNLPGEAVPNAPVQPNNVNTSAVYKTSVRKEVFMRSAVASRPTHTYESQSSPMRANTPGC
jgi:hypothetical protein